jgi:RND superfamily putative drug exporter
MFERLGRVVVRAPRLVILAWLLLAAAAALLAPPLSSVGSADETSFLPPDAESVTARTVLGAGFPDQAPPGSATLVISRDASLTATDRAYLAGLAAWATGPDAPAEVARTVTRVVTAESNPELASLFQSADGTTEMATVNLSVAPFQQSANDAVVAIRDHVAATAPPGLRVNVTGSAGIGRDYLGAIVDGTDRTTFVTVVLVILILLAIYRAPLAALLPLLTIGAAFFVSRGVLGWLAQAGWHVSSLIGSFVVVLVFGVGTDYTIFLVSRYREELARATAAAPPGADPRTAREAAVRVTLGRIGAVIGASAATVVVGLGAMAFARFGMIQTTGPALALAIVITLFAGLTLAPALLVVFGPALFWPRHPRPAAAGERGSWDRIAALVVDHPILVSVAVLGVLAIPLVMLPGLRTSFNMLSELPANADARVGFDRAASHLDRGRLMPITIVVSAPGSDFTSTERLVALEAATKTLVGIDGVGVVRDLASPSGTGLPDAFRPSGQLAAYASQVALLAQPGAVDIVLAQPAKVSQLQAGGAWLRSIVSAAPWVQGRADFRAAADAIRSMERGLAGLTASRPPTPAQAAADKAAIADAAGPMASALKSLSAAFAGRPDDVMLPSLTSGAAAGQVQRLVAAYVATSGSVTRILVDTRDDPYSSPALATVGRIRAALPALRDAFGSSAAILVGGVPAESADMQSTIEGDFGVVALATVLGILVVLVVLLRSVIAPLFLVGTVLLSYQTTLHLSAGLFQDVLGQPGATYFLPLLVFVLLVALGSDYNIFVTSRIREESEGGDLRAGIRTASARTGTVVTSAGVILAGTFGSLTTAPLQVLFQVGAAVALGVLLDTFIVRSLLVPALTAVFGAWSWWPSRAGRRPGVDRRPTAGPAAA